MAKAGAGKGKGQIGLGFRLGTLGENKIWLKKRTISAHISRVEQFGKRGGSAIAERLGRGVGREVVRSKFFTEELRRLSICATV